MNQGKTLFAQHTNVNDRLVVACPYYRPETDGKGLMKKLRYVRQEKSSV